MEASETSSVSSGETEAAASPSVTAGDADTSAASSVTPRPLTYAGPGATPFIRAGVLMTDVDAFRQRGTIRPEIRQRFREKVPS